jgi:hypothetical protein
LYIHAAVDTHILLARIKATADATRWLTWSCDEVEGVGADESADVELDDDSAGSAPSS